MISKSLEAVELLYTPESEAKNAEKKAKKRFDTNDYVIQGNTSNISFVKVYKQLKLLGVENNAFFLKLYDERLIDIDPHDKNLTLSEQVLVLNECKKNFYYFLREVLRIPVPGVDEGVQYILHRGNLAANWCIDNSFNFFLELPRQNGKSIAIDAALLWLYLFGTLGAQMIVMNKDHSEAKNNIGRIQGMRDCLPTYMQLDKKRLVTGEYSKISDKKESMTQPTTKNSLITLPSAISAEAADKLGRGKTVPFVWWDEFGYIKFIDIIYQAMVPAFKEAHDVSIGNGKRSCMMISTTPGDMNTDCGKYACDFRNRGAVFRDIFYDNTPEEVQYILDKNSKNGFFTISYQYRQLGKTEKYFNEMVRDMGDWNKIRREILLEWLVINESSPFDQEDIEELGALVKDLTPIKTLTIDKAFFLDIYKNREAGIRYILGVDVASGTTGDSSAIVVVNSKTKETVATFENNRIDTLQFSKVIHTIATQIYPNCVIAVERNNAGDSVLANLKKTDVSDKLYYEKRVNELDYRVDSSIHQKNTDGGTDNIIYGIWTDKKREIMFETLAKNVKYYKHRFLAGPLVSQVIKLIINKKGRVDHPSGGHDDLVMALNMAWWVIYNGKNRSKFGIVFYEDIDPDSGMTESEYQKALDEKTRFENQKVAAMYDSMNNQDSDWAKLNKPTNSINDMIAMQEKADREYIEKLNRMSGSNTGEIPLESAFGINTQATNVISAKNLYGSNDTSTNDIFNLGYGGDGDESSVDMFTQMINDSYH